MSSQLPTCGIHLISALPISSESEQQRQKRAGESHNDYYDDYYSYYPVSCAHDEYEENGNCYTCPDRQHGERLSGVRLFAWKRPLARIILWMRPANERRRYNVTSSLIGWKHAQNDLCISPNGHKIFSDNRWKILLILLEMGGLILFLHYTPRFNEVKRGVYWYHLVRLSVCPSVDRIVSALYLQQYSADPFLANFLNL